MDQTDSMEKEEDSGLQFSHLEEENHKNPSPFEEKDVDVLKGDAIGSTLYSESGLLNTLISLSKYNDESWSENFEEQLCFLWDMTFEADVVSALMRHDFINLACQVIQTSSQPRLIEILVGILGNMTALVEVRLALSQSSVAEMLFTLLSSSDTPTLLQLVRLLNSCIWHLNKSCHPSGTQDEDEQANTHSGVETWLSLLKDNAEACNKHLSFILTSSTNVELLQSTLELLNNLCCITFRNKYFSELLSTIEMMQGLTESLHQLLSGEQMQEDAESCSLDSQLWGERSEKAAQHWSQTLSTFTLHDPGIEVIYHHRQNIMRSICSILDPLGLRENIFPLNSTKLEIIDSLIDVLECFQRKHNYTPPAILPRTLTLLYLLSSVNDIDLGKKSTESYDFETEDSQKCTEVISRVNNYCLSVLCDTETSDFFEAFGDDPVPKIKTLLSNLLKCSSTELQKIVNMVKKHLTEIKL